MGVTGTGHGHTDFVMQARSARCTRGSERLMAVAITYDEARQ